MNILFTNSKGLGYGGAEVSISQYVIELRNRGHNIIIAASQEFPDINTEKIKFVEKWPYYIKNFYLKRKFKELIKKYSIDLVSPQDHTTTEAAILAAKHFSLPTVVHIRDFWFACPKSTCLKPNATECEHCSWKNLKSCSKNLRYIIDLYKWIHLKKIAKLIDSADVKVCVSSTVKNKLAKCGIKSNVIINPGARILEKFENIHGIDEFKKKYNLNKIVVTFIGSFFYTKGILQIFKFMPEILRKNQNVSLLLVGDGPLYNKVLEIIKKEKLDNRIVLTGRLPFKRIPLCYSASDILIAPHLWSAPLDATIIEASAASKPFIISSRGGTSDFIERYNYILPPEEIDLWKEKINFLIENPEERKKIGQNLRIKVEEMSMKSYVDRIEKIYSKVFDKIL